MNNERQRMKRRQNIQGEGGSRVGEEAKNKREKSMIERDY